MTRTFRTGALAAAVALAGGGAMAVTIDSFDDQLSTGMVQGLAGASATVSDTAPPATGYLGTDRSITATIESTINNLTARGASSSDGLGNGRFEFESSDNMVGTFELLYTGIGGLDFSDTPILVFEGTNNDAAFEVEVTLNGSASKTFTILAGNTLEDSSLNLHGLAGIDDVSSIGIVGTSQSVGGDISFDLVALKPVPVPAALPLLLAGMGGIAALSRRKRAG